MKKSLTKEWISGTNWVWIHIPPEISMVLLTTALIYLSITHLYSKMAMPALNLVKIHFDLQNDQFGVDYKWKMLSNYTRCVIARNFMVNQFQHQLWKQIAWVSLIWEIYSLLMWYLTGSYISLDLALTYVCAKSDLLKKALFCSKLCPDFLENRFSRSIKFSSHERNWGKKNWAILKNFNSWMIKFTVMFVN